MTTTVKHPEDLLDLVGTELGASDWVEIDQERIDLFADATDDHQWIHVDPERAAAGP
ncbi:MAG: dehydratase, partial [Actinobacteria bacterium]|nr:dehydratase [Actinomycetota bacterium]NIS30264.1 dehydratase [Actinomycetota bacterium]NIT94963.1 dehydratase [Actinomycetota bacterium]NIU18642.1 dehydratase [Actinomycetota bacterium]NIU65508.1 dehydratase [Actinomycetota bacterium]